jgi:hypothetical protein
MSPPFCLNAVTFCSHDATTLSIGLRITPAFLASRRRSQPGGGFRLAFALASTLRLFAWRADELVFRPCRLIVPSREPATAIEEPRSANAKQANRKDNGSSFKSLVLPRFECRLRELAPLGHSDLWGVSAALGRFSPRIRIWHLDRRVSH